MDLLREVLNPGWVSSLIGLLSLAAAVIIYLASRVGARPVFQRRALRLIGRDDRALPNEVEIRFDGRPVERLTKTHIVFWNSGKVILRGSDIVDLDPLRCDFSDESQVLAVRVLKSSRPTNQFAAKIDSGKLNRILLAFDYLDPGDGVLLEILHTDKKNIQAWPERSEECHTALWTGAALYLPADQMFYSPSSVDFLFLWAQRSSGCLLPRRVCLFRRTRCRVFSSRPTQAIYHVLGPLSRAWEFSMRCYRSFSCSAAPLPEGSQERRAGLMTAVVIGRCSRRAAWVR